MSFHGKKVITGLALAGFGVLLLAIGPVYASLALTAIILVGLKEYYETVRSKNFNPIPLYGYAVAVAFVAVALWTVMINRVDLNAAVFGQVCTGAVILILLIQLYAAATGRPPPSFADLAVTLFGSIYVGGLLSYTVLLWGLGIAAFPEDPFKNSLVLFLGLWGAFGVARGAYLSGMAFGKTKIIPRVSPNKPWAGALGGLFVGVLGTLLVGRGGLGIPFFHCVVLGALMSVMGMLGDLCESMFKREMHVKDVSHTLGTHGGVLDRMDSLTFVAPTAYYYLVWLRPWG